MSVGLGLSLVFVCLFRFSILCVFWLSLDYFVLVLFAFVVLVIYSSVLCQESTFPKLPVLCRVKLNDVLHRNMVG